MASKRGEPVQVIYWESGIPRLKLDALLPILEKVGDIPFAAMCINSSAKTDNSSLLTYFLRFYSSDGDKNWINKNLTADFELKSSPESETGGVRVWSEPFFLNKDGRRIAVLLMETQMDADYSKNYVICALSLWLASVYICNVNHRMLEMELTSTCIHHVLANYFLYWYYKGKLFSLCSKSLVVLIRDWKLPKDYAYGYHDKNEPRERNFFKDKMEVKTDMEEDVKEVHGYVLRYYETVAFYLLPNPDNRLQSEDSTQRVDKAYLDSILEFVQKVGAAENLVLKTKYSDDIITGHEMRKRVKYLNVEIDRICYNVLKLIVVQNQMALSTAMDAYKKKMDDKKPSDEGDTQPFEKVHETASEEAMMIFDKHKSEKYQVITSAFRILLKTQIRMACELYSCRAVQIVKLESEKVRVKLDALLPILENIRDIPLAVISVNGPMRHGKSYILSHFLRFLGNQGDDDWIHEKLIKEFDWNLQTTGIFVWLKPFFMLKDGRQIAVLLMDMQICSDEKTDYYINYALYSLSCLLSSVFIYNITQQMFGDELQFLQLFDDFARLPLEDCISKPNFVVMVRDWQDRKDYDYGYHDNSKPGEKNMLTDMLEGKNHIAALNTTEIHNKVIDALKPAAFCLLPHLENNPATDDEAHNLDQDFLNALQEVIPRICDAENIAFKTIDDQPISGFDMADIVRGWNEIITGASFDDMKSLASMAAEKQYEKALFAALETYTKQMDAKTDKYGFNEQMLEAVHVTAKKDAIVIFNQRKIVQNPIIEEEFLVKLEKEIQAVYARNIEITNILTKFYNLKEYSVEERARIQQEVKSHVNNVENKLKEKAKREKQVMEESEKMCKVKRLKQEWDKIIKQLIKKKIIREKIASEKKITILNEELNAIKEAMVKERQEIAKLKQEMEKAKLERDKLAQDFSKFKEKRRWFN